MLCQTRQPFSVYLNDNASVELILYEKKNYSCYGRIIVEINAHLNETIEFNLK